MDGQQEPGGITMLIRASAGGDPEARVRLVESIYGELRRLAGHLMRQEPPGHTLQPTALVNELFAKFLAEDKGLLAENRQHLFAISAKAMRHLLVDHARAKRAGKRGSGMDAVTLDPDIEGGSCSFEKLLLIHNALDRLQAMNSRQAEVAEMRVFGGFGIDEIATTLGVTSRTVNRDWQFVSAWLRTQLT
jgi:RNA polymerase sigma-70 factor (ECF subfamily)